MTTDPTGPPALELSSSAQVALWIFLTAPVVLLGVALVAGGVIS